MNSYISIAFLLIIILPITSFSQEYATISGRITDNNKEPIDLVNISVFGYPNYGGFTNRTGEYEFKIPAGKEITIVFSCIGYKTKELKYSAEPDKRIGFNISLEISIRDLQEVSIQDKQERYSSWIRIDPKIIEVLPDASGSFEAILKTLPGVSSASELSSQYSVRGGNFDENLVYVNDIEIYRPFLVRSGQQEGLSFINSDMVSSVLFSAGGFEAKYGDKISSVLDIKYKKPLKFGSTVSMSLLGGSAHIQGASQNHRLTHISGFRYKTLQYLLNTLDIKGDYKPRFTDLQTYLTYDVTDVFEINFLANYSQNKYHFIPETRDTKFGSINEALQMTIHFDGQEVDKFVTYMGAIAGDYHPNKNLKLKLIASAFHTLEEETFDIQGQYYLNELDKQLGSDNLGDSIMNIGVGTFLNHARNYLDATVINAAHKGYLLHNNHYLQWGLKFQHEIIDDNISEWEMIDSAGYSLPHPPDSIGYTNPELQPLQIIELQNVLNTKNHIQSNRITSYLQNTYSFSIDSADFSFTAGIRANFWDFNNQFLFSPRLSFAYKPNWKRDILFRFATGYYYQPPFYKELRDLSGNINYDIKAQKSVHFVLGSDYNFYAWNRPFKLIAELYYKHLDNLIPYKVDNVRIRYYATNNAHGYAAGIDMNINGEFVKGVDSWASLSIMQTKENIEDDFYFDADSIKIEPGYIPRPTDQRVNFGLFFQDYLPNNPSYKMHLCLLFGSRLPFGPPNSERYQDTLRMPPYRRVDIGFSKVLKSESKSLPEHNPFRFFNSIWITLEVFNLLDINNTISYRWITDIRSHQYAVPNYLTSRRLNIKLIAKF